MRDSGHHVRRQETDVDSTLFPLVGAVLGAGVGLCALRVLDLTPSVGTGVLLLFVVTATVVLGGRVLGRHRADREPPGRPPTATSTYPDYPDEPGGRPHTRYDPAHEPAPLDPAAEQSQPERFGPAITPPPAPDHGRPRPPEPPPEQPVSPRATPASAVPEQATNGAGAPVVVDVAVPGSPWWEQPSTRAAATPSATPAADPPPGLSSYHNPAQVVQCRSCGGFRLDMRLSREVFHFHCLRCGDDWSWQDGQDWPATTLRPPRRPTHRPPPTAPVD
jgi:hypothetical protein